MTWPPAGGAVSPRGAMAAPPRPASGRTGRAGLRPRRGGGRDRTGEAAGARPRAHGGTGAGGRAEARARTRCATAAGAGARTHPVAGGVFVVVGECGRGEDGAWDRSRRRCGRPSPARRRCAAAARRRRTAGRAPRRGTHIPACSEQSPPPRPSPPLPVRAQAAAGD